MDATLRRYVLLQAPSWLAAAAVAFALYAWVELPAWLAAVLVAGWVGKDFVLYPFMREAYERNTGNAPGAALVGSRGEVTQDVDPEGWVRVHGNLWQARSAAGGGIARGTRVIVEAVEGLCLVVRAESEPSAGKRL